MFKFISVLANDDSIFNNLTLVYCRRWGFLLNKEKRYNLRGKKSDLFLQNYRALCNEREHEMYSCKPEACWYKQCNPDIANILDLSR